LAVRFSTSGKFLASAGDDSCVCIYAPSNTAVAQGNLVEKAGPENWSRIKLCRGHGLDVVGLAWAPDDSHLVSCSLDSETPIIVWKLSDLQNNATNSSTNARGGRGQASMICNPFRVLGKGVHTSTVKGVAFDPAGSYLASSGDDPAVCIWRAHDDWGLEKRVDSSTGIFRRWNEDDAPALSNQSLFRRLSWSTDGAFVCSTNSVVKNKHVASTISREGWSVSSAQSAAAGAANLVGHKQPVVVSRHASQLLDARKKEDGDYDDDDDEEPEYATLLALGDKRGFVTVWSTKKSRPLFKLQCSESRCTVTDLAWGTVSNGDLMLLVSLLRQVVALRLKP
jgi:protein HIRA/HIR1